jgi:branched-chain amino acid transport system ATP-binding protein
VTLVVSGLDAWYGAAQVLFGMDLSVAPGEAVALLGRNGAGKSTTLRAILGLGVRRRGAIGMAGADLSHLPTHAIVRRGIGYVPEDRRIFTELSVEENLIVGERRAVSGTGWTRETLFAIFPNLAAMRGRRGGEMSGGEQQMLAIARTLMGNPAIVLLDEPSEGLAPRIVEQMAEAVLAMKREGLGILLCEQNLPFARLLCDRAYVLETGHLRFAGTLAELDARSDLRDAFLALPA